MSEDVAPSRTMMQGIPSTSGSGCFVKKKRAVPSRMSCKCKASLHTKRRHTPKMSMRVAVKILNKQVPPSNSKATTHVASRQEWWEAST
ncbi:hypothetical protein Mapa_004844 [Marchantia paleacea]|nr:hypothetical protein Mapa_004844 [Marchantia paleacea]